MGLRVADFANSSPDCGMTSMTSMVSMTHINHTSMRNITLCLQRVCLHTLAKQASVGLKRSGFSKSLDRAPQPERGRARHTNTLPHIDLIYRSEHGAARTRDTGRCDKSGDAGGWLSVVRERPPGGGRRRSAAWVNCGTPTRPHGHA